VNSFLSPSLGILCGDVFAEKAFAKTGNQIEAFFEFYAENHYESPFTLPALNELFGGST
jgi:hypothetical protein